MYLLHGHLIDIADSDVQTALAAGHAAAARPLCLCRDDGEAAMYIAKVGDRYVVKRMPGSGHTHDPSCGSFSPPPEVSGLAQVLGWAIRETADDPITRITAGFALTRRSPRPPGTSEPNDEPDGGAAALTPQGLLHLLWDDAGFTRWSPGMTGRRNWAVIGKYLLAAADTKTVNRVPLPTCLWVPETFNTAHKNAILARRAAVLDRGTAARADDTQSLLLVIGEVKRLTSHPGGAAIVLKHVPDLAFDLPAAEHTRMQTTFAQTLALHANTADTHLIALATAMLSDSAHRLRIDRIAVMTVTANWIPVESQAEKTLVDTLTRARRWFVKSLRYNLPPTVTLPAATLTDTRPVTTCYLTPSDDPNARTAIDELAARSCSPTWLFDPANPTPPPATRRGDPDPPALELNLPRPGALPAFQDIP